ncbi:MAG: SDR family NAD(P)-dependent oxidoreductase [Methylomicrobium sp.]
MSLSRTILVTGASSGIGRAVARQLLQDNHRVIGVSRDVARFQTTLPNFTPLQLDLRQVVGLPERAAQLVSDFPDIDAAVFCAGAGRFGSLEEFSYAAIEEIMTVNFTGHAFLTRALLPRFKQQGRGDLIYIGSEAALKGSRKGAVYCASKFALRGFTQALREECSKSGVRVGLINPGMVATPFFDTLSFEPGDQAGQYIEAEDVADAVLYMLNSNAGIVVDEINLSPLNKVVRFKKQ